MFKPNKKVLPILLALCIMLAFLSLGLGKYGLAPAKIWEILLHGPSFQQNAPFSSIEHQVVWGIRLPRILMNLTAGGALALAGAALQGVFHNPLVDPHIIGVSSGSAFGGTLAIFLDFGPGMLMASSFFFGLLALSLVYLISCIFKQKNNLLLVLAGVVLSGFFSALVSLMQYLADTEDKLPTIIFWLMGSFATANTNKLMMLSLPVLASVFILTRLRWRINVLSMGDADAAGLGLSVNFNRWLILIMCAVMVAAQVSVSGSIGWIGLVVPHLARLLFGPDHRLLLPASFCIGAAFMVIVDDMARMLTGAEIPLGILTALLGAPVFMILLFRSMRNGNHE